MAWFSPSAFRAHWIRIGHVIALLEAFAWIACRILEEPLPYEAPVGVTLTRDKVMEDNSIDDEVLFRLVPALAENLFSVLTLTRKHRFTVVIDADTMSFIRDKAVPFTASVADNIVAVDTGCGRSQP